MNGVLRSDNPNKLENLKGEYHFRVMWNEWENNTETYLQNNLWNFTQDVG
jgi:hypothetical protein